MPLDIEAGHRPECRDLHARLQWRLAVFAGWRVAFIDCRNNPIDCGCWCVMLMTLVVRAEGADGKVRPRVISDFL